MDMDRAQAKTGAQFGIIAGLGGAVVFLVLHAILITPLWDRFDVYVRAAAVAVIGGGLAGGVYAIVRPHLPFEGAARGASYGGLFALTLVPFLLAGAANIDNAPLWQLLAILVMLLVAVALVLVLGVSGPDEPYNPAVRERFFLVGGVALLVNAYPGYFLFFLKDPRPSRMRPPLPVALVLGLIYLGAGVLLEFFVQSEIPAGKTPARPAEAPPAATPSGKTIAPLGRVRTPPKPRT